MLCHSEPRPAQMVALVEMTHEIKIDGWRMEVGWSHLHPLSRQAFLDVSSRGLLSSLFLSL